MAGRADATLGNIVSTLKDVASSMVTSLGSLVDGLGNGSAKIEEIRNKIAEIDARFAMQLNDFYKDLKLLEAFYTRIYEKTEGIVEFGLSNVIPNLIELIEQRRYPEARREIASFLKSLATRTKEILDQLELMKVEEVKDQLEIIRSQYEKSKQQMDVLVGKERKAECFRIGTNTLLLVGISGAGMFIWGDRPISEKLELVSTCVANNPVLSFITDRGIQGLNAITATSSDITDLKKTIENQAQNMCKHFFNCHVNITEFQQQISTIFQEIKTYMKDVQSELQDAVNEKTTTSLESVKIYLKLMQTVFKRLHAEVVKRKISWENKPF